MNKIRKFTKIEINVDDNLKYEKGVVTILKDGVYSINGLHKYCKKTDKFKLKLSIFKVKP